MESNNYCTTIAQQLKNCRYQIMSTPQETTISTPNKLTTMGVKLDETTRERIKRAANSLDRTPHWFIKQSIFNYLELAENGKISATGLPIQESDTNESEENNHALNNHLLNNHLLNNGMNEDAASHSHQPFLEFAEYIQPQSVLRAAITAAYRRPEEEILPGLIEQARLPQELASKAHDLAYGITEKLRNQKSSSGRAGLVQNLLQEFSLSSQEGVALMCLAEALLRIPDKATRDALIRDKISNGNWQSHLGHSPSMFVNAATWGLMLTGKLVSTHNEKELSGTVSKIIGKGGEPVIRKAVDMAMRLMGEQFVTGETIADALSNAKKFEAKGFRYSYDMLGEAALTEKDAAAYLQSYQQAIHAIGKASNGRGIYEGPGISIKLSALHPRYNRANFDRVMEELYPIVRDLVILAKQYDIGINIDAEEADRLEISLDLLEKLCFAPELAGWNGIGFVIQAYQKRCPYVIDYIVDLAKRSQRRLMIRLVKGAYWDSEIKRAQLDGLEGYPVYTRKIYTDISYIACARKLLAEPNFIYPQFATHNAQTLSAIYQLAGNNYYPGQYEFQCLHGMGEPLYEQVVGQISEGKLGRPCRVYAPVGTHETLLAYLVRRLLENGANTSFVNRIADHSIDLESLVTDPIISAEQAAIKEGRLGLPHNKIPLPRALYGESRLNSQGLDLSNEHRLASLSSTLLNSATAPYLASPMLGNQENAQEISASETDLSVHNPANKQDCVGYVRFANEQDVEVALSEASKQNDIWRSTDVNERAACLERTADLMEEHLPQFMAILAREAGKTFNNAIAEVREAVDFLRYYAVQARLGLTSEAGLGSDSARPLGTVVCISPWNFPLAIFSGQIAAALAAGNCVIAKPAEQTSLVAAMAVKLFLSAGIPQGVLQLLPGLGETVGSALIRDPRTNGVMFTGSTQVAKILQAELANRLDKYGKPIALIAETGGLNAMVVDSSALTEQVVNDVVVSAFDSAGQRCSALRLLCLQEDVADHTLQMLRGAMAEYRMGNPESFTTDIGPVIDEEAKANIDNHIESMRSKGFKVFQTSRYNADNLTNWQKGTFVQPTLIELNQISDLDKEIFGPVLHVVRYKREELTQLIDTINATGYGLTFGVHTRIDETIEKVTKHIHAGNQYINRNIVGAVVGVQPFGGEGLSGTGPKAGGPLYLFKLLQERPLDSVYQSLKQQDCEAKKLLLETRLNKDRLEGLRINHQALASVAQKFNSDNFDFVALITQFGDIAQTGIERLLVGPTGERNSYLLMPRRTVLSLATNEQDYLVQLAAITAVGANVIWQKDSITEQLAAKLPKSVAEQIIWCQTWQEAQPDAIIFNGDADKLLELQKSLVTQSLAIIPLIGLAAGEHHIPLESLYIEQALSVNTAAAGGNASLMTIG